MSDVSTDWETSARFLQEQLREAMDILADVREWAESWVNETPAGYRTTGLSHAAREVLHILQQERHR